MPRGHPTLMSISAVCQGADYTDEERAFLQAIDRYKQSNQRPFPTWREVLAVIHSLGYRLVAEPGMLPTPGQIHKQSSP